jgi:sugar phosphate isomerase/epimerase
MQIGLHTGSIMYTNLVTDVRIAKATGYDAIEITVPKLTRYLDAGYQPGDLQSGLGSLQVGMINSFLHIERQDKDFRHGLRTQCERICAVAKTLDCPILQVVALKALDHEPWPEIRAKIGRSLAKLADIARDHGVRLALEPVSFTQLSTIDRAMEVLDVAARDNAGLCLDTFHLWTGGTPWDRVVELDPSLIYVAHISDVLPRQGEEWADADRDVLPGDGILPLKDGIEAIKATGFDGLWSVEMLGAYHWEWDPEILAKELRQRAGRLLTD